MARLVAVLGALISISVFAVHPSHAAEPASTKPPGWLIGVGYVSARNPYGSDVDTINTAIPLLGYIGERLTWLGPYLSYELVKAAPVNVTAVIEARFEGIPEDIDDGPLAGVRARKPTLEAGADVAYGRFIGSLRADVSGRHNGYELALGLQEERHFSDTWLLKGRVGAMWQSADLTSYLYGVDATEARPGLEFYEPGGALNYEASLFASYRLSPRWMALGSVALRLLDDDISSSPIVDRDHDIGGFVGVAYRFGHL
jgi:MipA family protein